MKQIVSQHPEVLGGEQVFVGTRVPVRSLFDHLEAGESIAQFLEGYPSVRREQVPALLRDARKHSLAAASCSSFRMKISIGGGANCPAIRSIPYR